MTSGKRRKETSQVQTTGDGDNDPRLAHIHPDALVCVCPGAKYISAGRKSYDIRQNSSGYWYILAYRGIIKTCLRGQFTSFGDAERVLIQYLKSKDKFGDRAFYPGSKAQEKYGKSSG